LIISNMRLVPEPQTEIDAIHAECATGSRVPRWRRFPHDLEVDGQRRTQSTQSVLHIVGVPLDAERDPPTWCEVFRAALAGFTVRVWAAILAACLLIIGHDAPLSFPG
jgi:hypothetical protein